MSSAEESEPATNRPRRKSRRTRACDMCRRRKVRCDGNEAPSGVCTNCVTLKFKCTYVQSAPKRPLDPGYVESLEEQVTEMRSLLDKYRRLYPGSESSGRLNSLTTAGASFTVDRSMSPQSAPELETTGSPYSLTSTISAQSAQRGLPLSSIASPALTDDEPDFEPSDNEVEFRERMIKPFYRSPLFPGKDSFQGKSSTMMFMRAALNTKLEYIGAGQPEYLQGLKDGGKAVADGFSQISINADEGKGKGREKEAEALLGWRTLSNATWTDHPWILRTVNKPPVLFEFPPSDLLEHLLSVYFSNMNSFSPVFHQPTIQRDIQDGLHYSDENFASVILLICAVASRKSEDPRVLLAEERIKNDRIRKGKSLDPTEKHPTYHSAGWQWFEQVQKTRPGISFRPGTLYDMQVAYLVAYYTVEASTSWHGVGYGLRIAQMIGAHRKKSYGTKPTVEGELRKRVFWALVLHDRLHSSVFGRACSIHDEDFDLDLPIACDDEYWVHPDPEQAFKQPKDKPSKVAYFNCMLRLSQIHAYALRTIYSINKSKALLGLVGPDGQQRVVAQIDSALNRWLDSIPEHLRWDPKMEDGLFFKQSVHLHASYYNVCIVVHRPFIPLPGNPSFQSLPSLTICTNAARSCIKLVDEEYRRTGEASEQHSIFMSAIVLLLNIWSEKKAISSPEVAEEIQLVRRVMEMVKTSETKSNGSAKIWEALHNLILMSEQTGPEQHPAGSKRQRDSEPTAVQSDFLHADPSIGEREIAGSKRAHLFQQKRRSQPGTSQSDSGLSGELSTMPPQLSTEGQHPTPDSSWNFDPSYGTYDLHSMSSFASAPGIMPPSEDVTMQPPIDPIVEALLSMLSPAQYQQAQVTTPNIDEPMSQNPGNFVDGSLWNDSTFGTSFQRDTTDGFSGKNFDPVIAQLDGSTSSGTTLGYDPSTTWSSAPSGFAWEDWEPYLANFRQEGEDTSGAERRDTHQQ
ncbi:fungal-specific transcription factor domain-containing protein [Irpex rosettiformis]|uniref:Fungal-specific transcription factor domain-containing protein n=1 Tax=Irpex rosettiformis TaxID=378272 RepID=A0ACB8UDL1_9APHY|nr:fungal-specific transcription factor domain-containing protein [Irpex rosettiformis]